jgi:hypothetical protein
VNRLAMIEALKLSEDRIRGVRQELERLERQATINMDLEKRVHEVEMGAIYRSYLEAKGK